MAIDTNDLIKGAITGAIGLLGTLISVGFSWIKDRDDEAQRLRLLDSATKRIQFWDTWLKIQLTLEPTDAQKQSAIQQVRNQTAAAQDAVDKRFHIADKLVQERVADLGSFEMMRSRLPAWRRWLLFYKPARRVAWIARGFFWVYFFEGLAFPLTMLDTKEKTDDPTILLAMVALELFAIGLWAIARAVEKPKQSNHAA